MEGSANGGVNDEEVEILSRLLKGVRSFKVSKVSRRSGKGTRNRKSHAEGVHRRISSRGFLRGGPIISHVYATREWSISIFIEPRKAGLIFTTPSIWRRRRPGFAVVAIRRSPRRRRSKEIEQRENKGARLFARRRADASRPLNDRERRFLPSATSSSLFIVCETRFLIFSLSLSPYLSSSFPLFLLPVPGHEGTKARCVNPRKKRPRSSFSLKPILHKRSVGLAGGLEPGKGGGLAHVSFLLRKTCQQKLDRYHRFFVPFLSRGEGMLVDARAHFKEGFPGSANANDLIDRRGGKKGERKESASSRILRGGGGGREVEKVK